MDDIKLALDLAEMELKAMYERNGYTGSNVLHQVQKAQEQVKNCSMSVVSFSSRDMLKEIIGECPYIFDYATVPKDKDMSNPQIAGSLIISYQRYLKAQEIVSDEI